MKHTAVYVDSFQSVDTVNRKTRYKDLKVAVLKAGRFSVFEATVNPLAAGMFDRLCQDPEVEIAILGFPWTAVKLKGGRK